VRALALAPNGDLYAGGTLAIVTRDPDVAARHSVETYGLARYDAATDSWGPADLTGGVSRDVHQMTFLDDRHLLLSGSFVYDEQWGALHNVAILDTHTGELHGLGGGLLLQGLSHVIASEVVHAVRGDELWFAGYFDHAGINANALHAAPVQANYVAMYDPTRVLDPNHYLEVTPVEPIDGPSGSSSISVDVDLSATITSGPGTIAWFERRSDGTFNQRGTGERFRASLRVAPGVGDLYYYVSVTLPDGAEGGKLPVRIPVR
jgi:hypothetical protein